ncbi:MAG: hypothetical protein WC342_09215 [Methanoregula sp.]|jgi:chromate transport protein ChrA
MELIKTIRGFHWVTKMVILLTVLLLGIILAAALAQLYWMSNRSDQNAFAVGQGLGYMTISLAWILTQTFLVILVIIAIYMAVMRIKTWIEKYLDAMLIKLDMLAEQKAEREASGATLATMNENVSRMDSRLEKIEKILEKVSD